MSILAFTSNLQGHRKSYVEFVQKEFGARTTAKKRQLLTLGPLLFLSIDDTFLLYCLVCFVRSTFGLTTSGFFLSPKSALLPKRFRSRVKRLLLKMLKSVNSVNTFLIVPQDLDENFKNISDGWIYDFQFWDLSEKDYAEYEDYRLNNSNGRHVSHLCNAKSGRFTVCSIGSQNLYKGGESFILNYVNNLEIREKYLFVVAGVISDIRISEIIGDFENCGGVVINKMLAPEELIELYASSDIVWALYPENYDQSSGIFGRAIQFGIPVVVRSESIIHKICISNDIEHIAMTKETVSGLNSFIVLEPNLSRGQELGAYFRRESLLNLKKIGLHQ